MYMSYGRYDICMVRRDAQLNGAPCCYKKISQGRVEGHYGETPAIRYIHVKIWGSSESRVPGISFRMPFGHAYHRLVNTVLSTPPDRRTFVPIPAPKLVGPVLSGFTSTPFLGVFSPFPSDSLSTVRVFSPFPSDSLSTVRVFSPFPSDSLSTVRVFSRFPSDSLSTVRVS
jgi:hypothetical protein